MTCRVFISFAAAATIIAVTGCTSSPSGTSVSATAIGPFSEADSTTRTALRTVQSYIWERTEEGAPYLIEATATRFDRLENSVRRRDGRLITRAWFRSANSEFGLEFILEQDFGAYVITRINLATVDDRPAGRTLYDRAMTVR